MVLQYKKDLFNLDMSKYTGKIGRTMQLILCTKKCLGFVVYQQKLFVKWQGTLEMTSGIICEMKQSSIQKGRKNVSLSMFKCCFRSQLQQKVMGEVHTIFENIY